MLLDSKSRPAPGVAIFSDVQEWEDSLAARQRLHEARR